MKLELKNIKVHLGLSEETHAYTAMLYADGKKAVEVSNNGHGGCDYQYSVNGHSVKEINGWCKTNLPKWSLSEAQSGGVVGATEKEFETDLEMWCHHQVNDHLTLRDLKRKTKAKALFLDEGQIWETGYKGSRKYDLRLADLVRQQNPDAIVLNELPIEKAFEIYKAHG
jgi:hypothetical protein